MSASAPLRIDPVVGLVLCGGRSRRMGQDKAVLDVGGRTMLQAAIETVERLEAPVRLACGERERYAELGRELVLDRVAGAGPLAGLEAGLTRIAEADGPAWVAVLACDMPEARAEILGALLAEARAADADACLLESATGVEPLYAVYHTRCLGAVREALRAGRRKMTSFHREGGLRVLVLEEDSLPAAGGGRARNVNTPRELVCARAAAGSEGEA